MIAERLTANANTSAAAALKGHFECVQEPRPRGIGHAVKIDRHDGAR